jgi:hypothetical protein
MLMDGSDMGVGVVVTVTPIMNIEVVVIMEVLLSEVSLVV